MNIYKQGTAEKLVTFSQSVSSEGQNKWEELSIGLTVNQPVDIEVICENTSNVPVFFDEISVKVQSVPTTILVQENHYYPFGLGMRGLDWTQTPNRENKYQYNGGVEKNTDFDLNWYETDFRRYDPQIGRLTGVDALAGMFEGISPFAYSYNNPILFNDPTGLCTDCATDENDFTALAEKYAVRATKIEESATTDISMWSSEYWQVQESRTPHFVKDFVNIFPPTATISATNLWITGQNMHGEKLTGLDKWLSLLDFIPEGGTAGKVAIKYAGSKLALITVAKYSQWTKVAGSNIHHIIPQALEKKFSSVFAQAGFDIHIGDNLMHLDNTFHYNHPAYNDYVEWSLNEAKKQAGGILSLNDIQGVINTMRTLTNRAENAFLNGTSINTLNEAAKGW